MPSVCGSSPDSSTSHESYGIVDGTCPQIANEPVEADPFTDESHFPDVGDESCY